MSIPAPKDGREIAKAKQSMRTRRKILSAAAIEFRNNGLSGARVSMIAKRAGMNIQALYHHFGSKDKLYTAVVEDVFARDWNEDTSEKLSSLPADEAIVFLWSYLFREFGVDRTYLALLGDVNTHKARHMKKIPQVQVYFRRVIEELRAIIARGEAAGLFRAGVDASLLYTLISGAQEMFINHSYTLAGVLDRDPRAKGAQEEWERFLLDFVLHGVRRVEAGGSPDVVDRMG